MSHIDKEGGAVTMRKRTLKTLLAAGLVALAIPVQAAVGMPTSDSGGPAVVQRSAPVVSEKVAGLDLNIPQPAPITIGTPDPWQQNLNARARYAQVSDPWALNLFARQSHLDRAHLTAGSASAVSTGGFDWGDAGIGAAFAFGTMLLGAASVATIRRRHRPLAH
jgi:hypothetical protein